MKKKKNSSLTPVKNRAPGWLRGLNLFFVLLSLLALLAPYVNPNYFWPLAILGLATPLLLLIHLIFVIFWSFRKKVYAIFSLVILIMSGSTISGLYGLAFAKKSAPEGLKVVTQNVRRLESYPNNNESLGPEAFQQHIAALRPDVLFLQEFVATENQRRPYLERLKAEGLSHIVYAPERSSLLIAARYPLRSIQNHYYNNLVNGYQIAELQLENRKINLVNVHLRSNQITGLTNQIADEGDLKEKETWQNIRQALAKYKAATTMRTHQAENIAQTLTSFRDPNIICGDFNDISQSYTYRQLKGKRKDAFLRKGRSWGSTYAGKIPGLRIDFILYDPALQIQSCYRGPAAFSDHHPVIAFFD
ncbi:MAG TPA: endonuclease/exonuclease/phosphatase family protein [Saprospiraceae bacterium]|nr:endonuclease/exonuclease/phosphatase family protein [Saprospiraceae bacterium]